MTTNKNVFVLADIEVLGTTFGKVKMESRNPILISLDLVVDHMPSSQETDEIQNNIEQIVGEDVTLKAAIRVGR